MSLNMPTMRQWMIPMTFKKLRLSMIKRKCTMSVVFETTLSVKFRAAV